MELWAGCTSAAAGSEPFSGFIFKILAGSGCALTGLAYCSATALKSVALAILFLQQ